jgi:hypothetical protein
MKKKFTFSSKGGTGQALKNLKNRINPNLTNFKI